MNKPWESREKSNRPYNHNFVIAKCKIKTTATERKKNTAKIEFEWIGKKKTQIKYEKVIGEIPQFEAQGIDEQWTK